MTRSAGSQQESSPAEDGASPPARGRAPWGAVTEGEWGDWRWQLRHRLSSLEDLGAVLRLTPEEVAGIGARDRLRLDVTPYFASLMDPEDSGCPIRRQVIPSGRESESCPETREDSLDEEGHSPVPGLVHRYPDRVLMLVSTQCASYCRYCTRSRVVGDPRAQFGPADHDAQLRYIEATPTVRDVLVSGGDPLLLSPRTLDRILARLGAIPHVQVVRLGTRVPVFLPQRIDDDLVAMLRSHHPLWMNIHFNHPREITPEVRRACARLADAGIPLGSQTVLLAGINDCPNVMRELVQELVAMRVRPYYLYQCDEVQGAAHFRTPVGKGIEIVESLRGHTSGFAVPTFVIDAPEGGGKVPVSPQYVVSRSDRRVVLRNYEGFLAAYTEPAAYCPHDPTSCPSCRRRGDNRPGGVAGLLTDRRPPLAPGGSPRSSHRLTGIRWGDLRLTSAPPADPD